MAGDRDGRAQPLIEMVGDDAPQARPPVGRAVVGGKRPRPVEGEGEDQGLAAGGGAHVEHRVSFLNRERLGRQQRRLIEPVWAGEAFPQGDGGALSQKRGAKSRPALLMEGLVVAVEIAVGRAFCHGVTVPVFSSLVNRRKK